MLAAESSLSQVQHVVVTAANAEQRIDNFLIAFLRGVPKSHLYRIIRKGEVRVNKKRIDVSYRLTLGDIVRVPPLRLPTKQSTTMHPSKGLSQHLSDAILFENDELLIIDKPAGLAVHGGSGISLGLIEALRAMRPENTFLELVHRLDRETSGCVMIAKKRSMLVYLHECLQKGSIQKHYLALTSKWRGGKAVAAPLKKFILQSGERMVKVDPQGKEAETQIKVLESFPNASLLRVTPITGRTHQIRVHCAFMNSPILGDEKYGNDHSQQIAKTVHCERLFLHAHELTIKLPKQPGYLTVTSPLPQVCEQILITLRQ